MFSTFSRKWGTCNIRKCFSVFGVFCTINWYFEYDIRIMCLFLYIWSWTNVIFEKMFGSVNNFRTTFFSGICLRWLVVNGPLIINVIGKADWVVIIVAFRSLLETAWEHEECRFMNIWRKIITPNLDYKYRVCLLELWCAAISYSKIFSV